MEHIGETPKVNDGSGLFDNKGLIDTLISDCNELPKLLIENQFVAFGLKIAYMVQKLNNLKDALDKESDYYKDQIEDLNRLNDELAGVVYGVPITKGDSDASS